MFGVYSRSHAMSRGYSIYSTPSEEQVEVTSVFHIERLKDDQWKKVYLWEDARLVGTVTKFIKNIDHDRPIKSSDFEELLYKH